MSYYPSTPPYNCSTPSPTPDSPIYRSPDPMAGFNSTITVLSQTTFTSSISSPSSSTCEKRKISVIEIEDDNTPVNPFQYEPNIYESLDNALWYKPLSLYDLIICLFKGFTPALDCESKRFSNHLATKLTTAVDRLVASIVTTKEREATHELLFQLYFLQAAFDNVPRISSPAIKVATETLQNTIEVAIVTICSNLSQSEKSQAVRYANILDIPSRDKANKFRTLIQTCLYRIERAGETTLYAHWASHQEVLDYILDKLHSIAQENMLSQEYVPLEQFLNNSIPNTKNGISCTAELIPVLENLRAKLEKGIEVQLPKYFHSVTDPKSNQILTDSYFEQDFETPSQNPLSTFIFTNAIDIASKNFPELYVAYPATPLEWNSDSPLLSYFTPEESVGFQEEKWLQFSHQLPILMRNSYGDKTRPYCHMIVSYAVSDQKRALDAVLKGFDTPIEIPVISPIQCQILCYFLRRFPLLVPLDFPTENKVNSDQIRDLVRPTKKAKANADLTHQFATGILGHSHPLTQTQTQGPPIDVQLLAGFVKTIKEVQATLATLTFDVNEHDLLKDPSFDDSYLKENFKSSGFVKNDPTHIRPLIKLTLDDPLRVKEASLAGLFSKPFANRDPEAERRILTDYELYKEKRKSQYAQLNENQWFKDKGIQNFFPPTFRHLWEGDPSTETCTQLVGYHPLILFNSQMLQSALFHLSFEILERETSIGKVRFLNLKEENNRTAFFKILAYEILLNSDVSGEKLIFTWKQKMKEKDNVKEHKFTLDWRSFETVCPEGYDYRPTPNEPVFTKKLQLVLKKIIGPFHLAYTTYLNTGKYPPNFKGAQQNAVDYFNNFVEEFGFAIYKRYFAPRDQHLQMLTIPNAAMGALLTLPNTLNTAEIINGNQKAAILSTTKNSFITSISD